MGFFFGTVLSLLAIFLILLVLVQRGRGGGLAGALGGMGGSSAFGAKAGDIFTRITIVVVAIWIVICILAGHWARNKGDLLTGTRGEAQPRSESLDRVLPVPSDPTPPGSAAPVPAPSGPTLNSADSNKGETPAAQPETGAAAPAGAAEGGADTSTKSAGETKIETPPVDNK